MKTCPNCHHNIDNVFESFYEGKWHKWLAWYPVKINNKWIWFKFIERQRWGTLSIHPDRFPILHSRYRLIND